MSKTFIYALIDPDTQEVRYVGKSDKPEKRLKRHLGMFEPKSTHKQNWIRSLLVNGKSPIIKILEEVELSVWNDAEKRWIKHYKDMGARLTNTTEGGMGGTTFTKLTISDAERTRRRDSASARMKAIWDDIRRNGH